MCFTGYGQSITILQEGTANDSSYYDIFKINNNEFWIGGKYGILKKVDSTGNISEIIYPNSGDHILSINKFDSNTVVVTGDKGLILTYDKHLDKWHKRYLNGFKNSSFYRFLTVNDSTAYIAGGSSVVAFGGKNLPKGFILKTTDKGKSWKKIYSNLINMVWDIVYVPADDKIYASIFSPFRGNIITSSGDKDWQKLNIGKGMLIHTFSINQGSFILGGTSKKSINKIGIVRDTYANYGITNNEAGSIWSVYSSTDTDLITASNGFLYYRRNNDEVVTLKTAINYNLYESSRINNNSFYIIGSKKTLIRLNFPPESEALVKQ